MRKSSWVARLLPAAGVSGVLVLSFFGTSVHLFGSLSGYGYGACGYGYTYTGSPVVTSVSPNSGPFTGGTSVKVFGSGFCNDLAGVNFGSTPSAGLPNVVSDNEVDVVSPVHSVGTVDVTVITAGGTSATSPADQFTFTLLQQYFPWYDLSSAGTRADTIHITNVSGATATGSISLPGATSIAFSVANGADSYFSFPRGTIGGPVTVSSNKTIITTLRAWYYSSFNETPGRSGSAAATTQYFPWYDLSSTGTRADTIHITNVSGATATGTISLTGASSIPFTVNNGADSYFSFPRGTIGGPVKIQSSSPVLASLRAWYNQSFNEVAARPAGAAATTQYFPWYDLSSAGTRADTIHITNVSGGAATGTIALGTSTIPFSVNNGEDKYFSFTRGTIGGPVKITSTAPVIATLRAWYYLSFNEVPGRAAGAAATTQYFPWYDLMSTGTRADTIHITNPGLLSATGTIVLGSTTIPFTVAAGADAYFSFARGKIGGPVTITSSQPVLAALRAWYYQSFNEVPGYQ